MSLILDALNKADQERSEQHEVPNLRAVHGSPYPQAQPGLLKRWSVEIVFVALLLIAYLGYQLLVDDEPQPQPQPAKAQAPLAPPQQVVTRPSNPVPVVATAPLPVSSMQDTEQVLAPVAIASSTPVAASAPVESPAANVAQPVASPARTPVKVPVATPLDTQRDVKSLYAQQRSEAVPTERASPAAKAAPATPAVPRPLQRATPVLDRKAQLEKLPLLSELSPQRQQAIPSIDFSLHVYSSDQDTGFVTLNGQRRRPGDQVAAGLRLEKIVDEFIVLSYKGSEFRLLSLNSWINLQ